MIATQHKNICRFQVELLIRLKIPSLFGSLMHHRAHACTFYFFITITKSNQSTYQKNTPIQQTNKQNISCCPSVHRQCILRNAPNIMDHSTTYYNLNTNEPNKAMYRGGTTRSTACCCCCSHYDCAKYHFKSNKKPET